MQLFTDFPFSLYGIRDNFTLDDSHRTGTTEIVQAIKSVEENTEDSK